MTDPRIDQMTLFDALVCWLDHPLQYNRNVVSGPAAILWTDEDREWAPLMPLVRKQRPQLITLGEYDPHSLTGPAIWIRCILARRLEGAGWSEQTVPIVYLPGVSRAQLRDVEGCPPELHPLLELQFRGAYFSQENSRDWSLLAFLKSSNGLGLDVSQDSRSLEAMRRAILPLAQTTVGSLRGRRLEASDFDLLLTPDPIRDLLTWLSTPASTRKQWGVERWSAFRAVCFERFNFDPDTDGELVGADHLGRHSGAWLEVWQRFAENPQGWSGIEELLTRVERPPTDMFEDRSSWPGHNARLERELKDSLCQLEMLNHPDAIKRVRELEKKHGIRRSWVWARLDRSPLALALEHLSALAQATSSGLSGTTPGELGASYAAGGWKADDAALRAVDCVRRNEDVNAVRTAIRAVYLPWLQAQAERFQDSAKSAYPGAGIGGAHGVQIGFGECLLFADGLRFDVGERLAARLVASGHALKRAICWVGPPTVTATCKPAQSPIAAKLMGRVSDTEFSPSLSTGEGLTTHRFRKLLTEEGIQYLEPESVGTPSGRAWTEHGQLDHMGHEQGWKLAWRIEEQVQDLSDRVQQLLTAGWQKVRVVTDHGWLLMPGGLPKVTLPGHLAETRWGRCAVLKATSQTDALVVPWRWSAEVPIAMARGISCFVNGMEYAHGGMSIQECLTPVLEVSRTASTAPARIDEFVWRGLRCRVRVADAPSGAKVDLRVKPNDVSSSLCAGGRSLDAEGRASLLVDDDRHMGSAVFLVVVANESVVAKTTTSVGE